MRKSDRITFWTSIEWWVQLCCGAKNVPVPQVVGPHGLTELPRPIKIAIAVVGRALKEVVDDELLLKFETYNYEGFFGQNWPKALNRLEKCKTT